jgi:Flp pilus assembly pilin Flp
MTTVEYALLLGLITLASIGAFAALGSGNHNSVTSSVSRISGSMSHAATAH